MSNTLGCGDNLPDGACFDKRGDWKLKINIPITRKVGVKLDSDSWWEFYPYLPQLTEGTIGWQLIPWGNYRVYGTVTNISGESLEWTANVTETIVSDDLLSQLTIEERPNTEIPGPSLPNFNFGAQATTFYVASPRLLAIDPNPSLNPVIDLISDPHSGIVSEPSESANIGRFDFVKQGTVTYGVGNWAYVSGQSPANVESDRVLVTDASSFTIDRIEINPDHPFYQPIVTLDDNPIQVEFFYYRPHTIRALQDDFLPDYEFEEIITPEMRIDAHSLKLGYLDHLFAFETMALFIDEAEAISIENPLALRKGVEIRTRPMFYFMYPWQTAFKSFLERKASEGIGTAQALLEEIEDSTFFRGCLKSSFEY